MWGNNFFCILKMLFYRTTLIIAIFIIIFSFPVVFGRAMSSTNFQIDWDSLNSGGTEGSSSDNFSINDTLGGIATGDSSSINYEGVGGYRGPEGEEPVAELSFNLEAQDNTTEVAFTGFSDAGLTVVVASAVDYSVNDYIAVVENVGQAQLVAVGKIVDITGTMLTVDAWEGDNASMPSGALGSDDFVYKLWGNAVDLELIDLTSVKTGVSFFVVNTNATNGYEVFVTEDGNFRTASFDIDDVSDGTVSAGSEEFGIESLGADVQNSGDWAVTSGLQTISSNSVPAINNRTAVIYKTASDEFTESGNYSNIITFYCIANF